MLSSLKTTINPSLPQHVKNVQAARCTDVPSNSIFSNPVTHLLSMLCVLMKLLLPASVKKKRKGSRVSNFTFIGHFKWHHGSEGVKKRWWQKALTESPRKQHSAEKWALQVKSHFQRLWHTQVLSLYVFKLHIFQINVTSIWWQKQFTETGHITTVTSQIHSCPYLLLLELY